MLVDYVKNLNSVMGTSCVDMRETAFKRSQSHIFKIIDKMFERSNNKSAYTIIEENHMFLNKLEQEMIPEEEEKERTEEMFGGFFE